jgi:hypothetical protein
LLAGRDYLQVFLGFSTFSLVPVFVYSAPANLFISSTRKSNSLRIIAIALLAVSFIVFLVSSLLLGSFTLDRVVGRTSYLFLIYALFCIIHILTRPAGVRNPLVSQPLFFLSLFFLFLSGFRSLLIAFLLSFLFIVCSYISICYFRVRKTFVERAIALSGLFSFTLPLLFFTPFLRTFVRSGSDGFFQDSYRYGQLQCFLSSIATHPILGAGLSSVPSCWTYYLDNVSKVIVELEIFNLYFQLGLLYALIVFLYLLLSLRNLHAYVRDSSGPNSPYYLLASVCLVACPASSFFSPILYSFSTQFFILVTLFLVSRPPLLQSSTVVHLEA